GRGAEVAGDQLGRIGRLTCVPARHAELVSASIAPTALSSPAEKWTLKQVQGDGGLVAVEAQKLLGISLEGRVG
ncbi:MAG: hypothetical protein V4659_06915, partial [Pseudomonadota bacterium]